MIQRNFSTWCCVGTFFMGRCYNGRWIDDDYFHIHILWHPLFSQHLTSQLFLIKKNQISHPYTSKLLFFQLYLLLYSSWLYLEFFPLATNNICISFHAWSSPQVSVILPFQGSQYKSKSFDYLCGKLVYIHHNWNFFSLFEKLFNIGGHIATIIFLFYSFYYSIL
jgi:hypothetical protein